jgi:hypothetical protein
MLISTADCLADVVCRHHGALRSTVLCPSLMQPRCTLLELLSQLVSKIENEDVRPLSADGCAVLFDCNFESENYAGPCC